MRRLVLLVALVLAMGTLSAPPAAAWEPPGGAVFNTPPPWGDTQEAYKIIRHVEAAIRAVPADPDRGLDQPEILVTTYLLDRKPSIDALIDACKRGVSVRVIIDKGIETSGSVRLARALNGDNVTTTEPTPETGACGAALDPATATSRAVEEQADDGTPKLTEDEAVVQHPGGHAQRRVLGQRRQLPHPVPRQLPRGRGEHAHQVLRVLADRHVQQRGDGQLLQPQRRGGPEGVERPLHDQGRARAVHRLRGDPRRDGSRPQRREQLPGGRRAAPTRAGSSRWRTARRPTTPRSTT